MSSFQVQIPAIDMKTYIRAYADSKDPDQPAHLRCLQTEWLAAIEQRPGWDFAHDDLNLRMFQDTFSFDVAHV